VHLALLHDERTIDTFEIEIARDFGVEKNLHEVSMRHDELGNQIDIKITILSIAKSSEELQKKK